MQQLYEAKLIPRKDSSKMQTNSVLQLALLGLRTAGNVLKAGMLVVGTKSIA